MTQIKKITDKQGNDIYLRTHTKAVVDDNGYTAESRLQAMQDEINQAQLKVGAVPSDLTPTEGSSNWVTSGGVYNELTNYPKVEDDEFSASLDISDGEGYVLARFKNGEIVTKNFDSSKSASVAKSYGDATFYISDEEGNVLIKFKNGHIATKNFNSEKVDNDSLKYGEVPSHFTSEVLDTKEKIKTALSNGGASIVIPIITDNHIDWTARDRERVYETLSCISNISKDLHIDAVVNLGDIPSMWGRNGVTDLEIFDRLKWYIDTYKGVHKNVFMVNGNHDGESSDFFNNDEWYPMNVFNRDIACREGNSPYFYFDFNDMKLRIIFLSIPCSTENTRTTEGITTYYPSERTVHTYWGAGTSQLNWLANTALKTGDGWSVIVMSHTPICYNYSSHDGIYDLMGRVEDQVDIEGIFNAYHNHTSYSSNNVECDFTDYGNTRVLLAIAGHRHADEIINIGDRGNGNYNINGMPCKYVTIGCQMLGNRVDKTVNQDLYDYMVYNQKSDKFDFIRFGNGEDRVVTL